MSDGNVTAIDDVAALERAALAELDAEFDKAAVARVKASLKKIKDAQRIVANLELDHAGLLADLRAGR